MKRLAPIGAAVLMLAVWSQADAIDARVRIGQGGLRDERVPDGKLGGGQLALDLKRADFPLVVSIATEYYKKSPQACDPYEIQGMWVAYLLYRRPLPTTWDSDVYLGGGIGLLEVPESGKENTGMERAIGFDAAFGVSTKLFWRIGAYIEGKYLYSRETEEGMRTVDFSDFGALVGLFLDFDWWES